MIWLEIMQEQVSFFFPIKSFSFFLIKLIYLGCGKTIGGSKTVYKYDAGGCGKGVGREVHTCA
jgi:hypothetical protein